MSFVSKIADLVRGEFEITCFTHPDLGSSFPRTAHGARDRGARGTRDANGRSLGPSMQLSKTNGSRLGHIKPNSYAQKPPTKNKLVEYIKGETDILCFAPTPEDYSSTSARNSVDGLVPNTTDDEDDDLIYVDIGYNSRSKQSERHPANFMNGTKISTSKDSSPDSHLNSSKASPRNYSPTDHHLNNIPSSAKYSSPYSQIRLANDMNNLSFDKKRQGIGLKTDHPSPTNVMSGFSSSSTSTQLGSSSAFAHVDTSGSDFLKTLYARDNGNFIGSLLDSDDSDSLIVEKEVVQERSFDFESAGFSTEEALMIKRRIKLQKLVRSLNSSLTE